MSGLIRPHLIGLDSSHLAELARDRYSPLAEKRQAAKAFIEAFEKTGCLLFLTLHHVEELARHRDESIAQESLAFISELPFLSWARTYHYPKQVGSILDLLIFETDAAFLSPLSTAKDVLDEVIKRLANFGTGQEAVAPFLLDWKAFRQGILRRENRNREIIAISRSEFTDVSKMRATEALQGRLRTPADTLDQLQALETKLAQDIKLRGDKRIIDPTTSAKEFFQDVKCLALSSLKTASAPFLQLLSAQDIDLTDIDEKTTIGDLGDLATFRRKLRLASNQLSLPWIDVKSRVTEDKLPSLMIQASLRKYSQILQEHKGSDLTDAYLTSFAAYVDVTYVDKRTHENVIRCKRKDPKTAVLCKHVEKTGNYAMIPTQLSSFLHLN